MRWTGHLVRMVEGQLPEKTDTMKYPGCRKRSKLQIVRWEECVKRDVRKADDRMMTSGGRRLEIGEVERDNSRGSAVAHELASPL